MIHYVKDFIERDSHSYSNYFEKLLTIKEKGTEKNSPAIKIAIFQLKDFKYLIKPLYLVIPNMNFYTNFYSLGMGRQSTLHSNSIKITSGLR